MLQLYQDGIGTNKVMWDGAAVSTTLGEWVILICSQAALGPLAWGAWAAMLEKYPCQPGPSLQSCDVACVLSADGAYPLVWTARNKFHRADSGWQPEAEELVVAMIVSNENGEAFVKHLSRPIYAAVPCRHLRREISAAAHSPDWDAVVRGGDAELATCLGAAGKQHKNTTIIMALLTKAGSTPNTARGSIPPVHPPLPPPPSPTPCTETMHHAPAGQVAIRELAEL